MRPDQHKKKKNSEYKKKHGIPSEKGENHDKKGSTGRPRSDEKPTSDASKMGLEKDGTNVDTESNSHESRNFSRRKLESNWEKYKEDFEDESEPSNASPALSSVPIGADFQSLLDNATSGSSHFQFKGEKEWENLNTDEANKDGPSLLSIDCHALAQSLRNIPLERRLDIDKKYSIEEEYSDLTANRIQPDKLARNRHTNDQETTKNNSGKPQPTESPNNMNLTVSQANKLTKASDRNEKCPMVHTLKSLEQKSQHSTNSEGKMEKHEARSTKSDAEDDLELLLGTDNNKLNSTHTGDQTGTQAIQTTSGLTNKVDVTTVQKPAKDTKEDLEDWLDSILD